MEKEDLLNEVMTAAEVAEKYKLDRSTVRKWCVGQKGLPPLMPPGTCRQSAKTWLLVRKYVEEVVNTNGVDNPENK